MSDFKPAWWQVKKPFINRGLANIIGVVCVIIIIVCLFMIYATIANKKPDSNLYIDQYVKIIIGSGSTLFIGILLNTFNCIER
jgi:apolipoprotein N-acyltransferase